MQELQEIAHGKSYGVHALTIQKRINRAKSKDFHTDLGLFLAANNLPLFSRQSKTKLAAEASANVEKKSKQKLFINLIGQSAVIVLSFSDRRRNFYLLSIKLRKMAAVLQAFEVKP